MFQYTPCNTTQKLMFFQNSPSRTASSTLNHNPSVASAAILGLFLEPSGLPRFNFGLGATQSENVDGEYRNCRHNPPHTNHVPVSLRGAEDTDHTLFRVALDDLTDDGNPTRNPSRGDPLHPPSPITKGSLHPLPKAKQKALKTQEEEPQKSFERRLRTFRKGEFEIL
jgi:hypothetical protein